jgi:predicted ATPase
MHFERGRDIRRAVIYLEEAAKNARQRSAYAETRMHFDKALQLLQSQPHGQERMEREGAILTGLGGAIQATHGWGANEAAEAYSRARALFQGLSENTRAFPTLWGLWLFYWGRGSLSSAKEVVEELLALARQAEDRALLLQAHHAAWATALSRGDLEATLLHTDEGLRLYDAGRDATMASSYGNHDTSVCCRMFRARALALLGRTEEATRTSNDSVAVARQLAHPFSQALALVFAAGLDQVLRDETAARTHASAALAIAREQDFKLMFAWATVFEGWAEAQQGQHEAGLLQITRGMSAARAIGCDQFQAHLRGLLAEVHLKAGQAQPGLRAIDEALVIAFQTGERFCEAELLRLKGQLQLAETADSVCDAEQSFLQALEIARRQGAKLFVLRIAVSLGQLWLRQGRYDEARALIANASRDMGDQLLTLDSVEVDALLSRCSQEPSI